MYDAAREVRFRGVSGSVVTRREGSNNLATASLAAAARQVPSCTAAAAGKSDTPVCALCPYMYLHADSCSPPTQQ